MHSKPNLRKLAKETNDLVDKITVTKHAETPTTVYSKPPLPAAHRYDFLNMRPDETVFLPGNQLTSQRVQWHVHALHSKREDVKYITRRTTEEGFYGVRIWCKAVG